MGYLHEKIEEFTNAVNLASEQYAVLPVVVEKDYYVTMILRCLSERLDYVVFKGGTSLSKCHNAIKRFSEDIDITIDTKISQGQMRNLKQTIQSIAMELGLEISNINDTRSRRSFNQYKLEYQSVISYADDIVRSQVLLETSFTEVSFPTVILPVHSYIGSMMATEAPYERDKYKLEPFEMKVQGLDRTLIDKVFAICDYYMDDNMENHSRHIYDVYKLFQIVPQNDDFKKLVNQVRVERAKTNICPSAKPDVYIPDILKDIVKKEVYLSDYNNVTLRILEEKVSYETAIAAINKIALSGMFAE